MKTKLNLSWNDIVFEFKNKDYGAFFLRAVYKKDITIATGISLLILLLLVGPPFIMAKLNRSNNLLTNDSNTGVIFTVNPRDVPPPPPPPPPIKDQARFIAPIVVDSADNGDIRTFDQQIDSALIQTVIPDDIPDLPPNTLIDPPVKDFIAVEEMPVFPGGDDAMMGFITKNFVYPQPSKEIGITGKVYVDFIVNEKGKVVDVAIARGLDKLIDKEAVRVVESLPNWTPGKQGGKEVRVKFNVAIKLTLD